MDNKCHLKPANILKMTMSLLLAVALIIPTSLGLSLNTNAAVKIKTQAAANSFFADGAIRGIDVSKWQGNINWGKVAQDDVKYAFVRATYGAESDPYFVANAKGAHQSGIKIGGYHFARFKNSASMKSEAQAFVNQLKKVDITYPVVLDMENHFNLNRKELTNLCIDFIKIVEKEGYTVLLYSYQNFIDGRLNKSMLKEAGVDMWVANYKESPQNINHVIWQHTSSGKVSGISGNVDINVAYKDLSPRKALVVDATLSGGIVSFLNENYSCEMDPTKIDIDALNYWISAGVQSELNRFHDATLQVTGQLNNRDVDTIIYLDGNDPNNFTIIRLMQAKLFYKGFYTEELSGRFSPHFVDALKAYQGSQGLEATGNINAPTLNKLFNVDTSVVVEAPETSDTPDAEVTVETIATNPNTILDPTV